MILRITRKDARKFANQLTRKGKVVAVLTKNDRLRLYDVGKYYRFCESVRKLRKTKFVRKYR